MPRVTLENIIDFRLAHFQKLCKFFGRRLTLVLLFESHVSFIGLVIRADLILRQAHKSSLLGQRLQDRLTDPPYRIGNKLESLGLIKALCSFDQTEIAFVDQIAE